jgi:methionyl-tRNA formyltransferase
MSETTQTQSATEYKQELSDVSTEALERRLDKFQEIELESRADGHSTDEISEKITAIQAELYTRQ